MFIDQDQDYFWVFNSAGEKVWGIHKETAQEHGDKPWDGGCACEACEAWAEVRKYLWP